MVGKCQQCKDLGAEYFTQLAEDLYCVSSCSSAAHYFLVSVFHGCLLLSEVSQVSADFSGLPGLAI